MIGVKAEISQRQLDAAIRRLDRYRDRPLQQRAQRAYLAGAQLLANRQRAAAPKGPTGNLRASIRARQNRLRGGNEMAAATAGTRFRKAPHRHLVTRGTNAHALIGVRSGAKYAVLPAGGGGASLGFSVPSISFGGGTGPSQRVGNVRLAADLWHPGSRANPFIDETFRKYGDAVQRFINDRVLDLGETFRVGG